MIYLAACRFSKMTSAFWNLKILKSFLRLLLKRLRRWLWNVLSVDDNHNYCSKGFSAQPTDGKLGDVFHCFMRCFPLFFLRKNPRPRYATITLRSVYSLPHETGKINWSWQNINCMIGWIDVRCMISTYTQLVINFQVSTKKGQDFHRHTGHYLQSSKVPDVPLHRSAELHMEVH